MNYDHLFVVCTESGTVLPLSRCYLMDLSDVPLEFGSDDGLTIEYTEQHGKPLIQELGL
jgi:hypothetical protein